MTYEGCRKRNTLVEWGVTTALERTYDLFGNPVGVLLPGPYAADVFQPGYSFNYDELDRPTAVYTSDSNGSPIVGSPFGATFEWGGVARPHAVTSNGGLGVRHGYAYSSEGSRLSELTIQAMGIINGDQLIGSMTYGWDAPRDLKTSRQVVSTAGLSGLTGSMGWLWGHDGAYRMKTARSGVGSVDPAGMTTHPTGDWDYGYGRGDELMSILETSSGPEIFALGPEGRVAGRGGEIFGYDDEGRRTKDDRFGYTWDWRGLLVEVRMDPDAHPNSGERVKYEYDASGRMLERFHYNASDELLDRRLFVWDGATLAAEAGLNHEGAVIWRKQYVPGPNGLDDSPQIRVETGLLSTPETNLYAFIRDELGNVIGFAEDVPPADGATAQLLARYLYTPYGEAFIEHGPVPLRIEFDESLDEVDGFNQQPPQPGFTAAGGVRLQTTIGLDPDSIEDGIAVDRWDGMGWQPVADGEFRIGLDDDDPTLLVVMPADGWPASGRYQITFGPSLTDGFGRTIRLPAGEQEGILYVVDVTDQADPPDPLPRDFDMIGFDSVLAAQTTFSGAIPGGQTSLFQGLWTDPVTGIAYARNRWYDARNASWLTGDPMGMFDSANLYAFVGLGPNSFNDPLGLSLRWYDWFGIARDTAAGMATDTGSLALNLVTVGGYSGVTRAYERGDLDSGGLSGAEAYAEGVANFFTLGLYNTTMDVSEQGGTLGDAAGIWAGEVTGVSDIANAGTAFGEGRYLEGTGNLLTGAGKMAGLIVGARMAHAKGTGAALPAFGRNIGAQRASTGSQATRSGGDTASGGVGQAAIRKRVMENVARRRAAGEVSNFSEHVRRVDATSHFQGLVRRANARLTRNPDLFAAMLEEGELIASASSAGLARMHWGNVVERLVRRDILRTPSLNRLYRPVGGAGNPDFVGVGRFRGLNFDATTIPGISGHMSRPGYGYNLIIGTYVRPSWFPLR